MSSCERYSQPSPACLPQSGSPPSGSVPSMTTPPKPLSSACRITPSLVGVDGPLLEAERLAEPVDRGAGVAVAQ